MILIDSFSSQFSSVALLSLALSIFNFIFLDLSSFKDYIIFYSYLAGWSSFFYIFLTGTFIPFIGLNEAANPPVF